MLKKIAPNVQASCLTCEARKFAWFQEGTDDQLRIRQSLRTGQYTLAANDYLFMEGDEHHTSYTLKQGWAICYKQLKDGRRQIVHIALPGDFLGYKTDPDAPIDYSVKAVSECMLCSFSEKNINQLLVTDADLIHRLIAIQTKQNQVCRVQLSYVGQSQAKNKVAFFLLDLVTRLKRRGVDIEANVHLPLSRIDIADAIGVTPVHLGRVSVELSQQGIVECRYNILRVKDLDALKNLADCC